MIFEEFKNKRPTLWGNLESGGNKHLMVFKPKYDEDSESFYYSYYRAKDNMWIDDIPMREAYEVYKIGRISENKEKWAAEETIDSVKNDYVSKIVETNKNLKEGFLSFHCGKFYETHDIAPTKEDLQKFIFIEEGVDLQISDEEYKKALKMSEF